MIRASIETRHRKDGSKVYVVRWRAKSGQRQETFDRMREAQKLKSEIEHGDHIDSDITVADYAREWVGRQTHADRTARKVAGQVEKHIVQTKLGKLQLKTVRPDDVQDWVKGRQSVPSTRKPGQTLAPATLHNLVTMLRSIFHAAVLSEKCQINPAVKVKLPSNARARVVPLTQKQVDELVDAMEVRWKAAVITQAGLGLRVGELLALRVSDVNFLRRSVWVAEQRASGAKGERSGPKTGSSGERTLPLPGVVADALAEHLRRWPPAEDGTIFTRRDGRPYQSDYYLSRKFVEVVGQTSLPPDTGTHDLRHHYASVLLAGGETYETVAEKLGHTNAREVFRTYGHPTPGGDDRVRQVIDEAWGRQPRERRSREG
jgi:integrase